MWPSLVVQAWVRGAVVIAGATLLAVWLEMPRLAAAPVDVPAALTRGALIDHITGGCHLVPAVRGGRVVGVKVFGIRADGPLARAGLENGDVLLQVGDLRLDTPAALQALAHRPTTGAPAPLRIERRGEPIRRWLFSP